jgi:multicomponent Na+:H+ antiporter subunit B
VGLLTIFLGGKYLQYDVLPLGGPRLASHIGIFAIEVGVGITVAAVMVTIFFETADRSRDKEAGGD